MVRRKRYRPSSTERVERVWSPGGHDGHCRGGVTSTACGSRRRGCSRDRRCQARTGTAHDELCSSSSSADDSEDAAG